MRGDFWLWGEEPKEIPQKAKAQTRMVSQFGEEKRK